MTRGRRQRPFHAAPQASLGNLRNRCERRTNRYIHEFTQISNNVHTIFAMTSVMRMTVFRTPLLLDRLAPRSVTDQSLRDWKSRCGATGLQKNATVTGHRQNDADLLLVAIARPQNAGQDVNCRLIRCTDSESKLTASATSPEC